MNLSRPILSLVTLLIRGYQLLVSPFLPPSCRFYPSCSNYALEAFREQGVGLGLWLSMRRLLKCHPFHPGGIDPVPAKRRPPENCGLHRVL